MSDYPSDPVIFVQLTPDENRILSTHLTSGWYKQAAVYPALSEPWRETEALLKELHETHHAAIQARLAVHKELQARIPAPERQQPEAGQ